MKKPASSTKIAVFGVFGAGNLGNECTLQALLHNLRQHLPQAEVLCICTGPGEALRDHDVSAACRIRDVSLPPIKNRCLHLLRRILVSVPLELYRWIKAIWTLKDVEMLVMVGTGMLGDFGIHPLDLHRDILRWSIAAKLSRCKLLFLSVGAGPIRHPLSRRIIRYALALGEYRSYRDRFSKQYLEHIGFDTSCDLVRPDLAFSFPKTKLPVRGNHRASKPVVGVGLISYFGRRGTSENGDATYRAYLEKLSSFVAWLIEQRYPVRLLIGDVVFDSRARHDLRELLEARGISFVDNQILDEPAKSVAEVLSQLSNTDFVVASRFHNILLAIMLNKPVVAISYHQKVDALMSQAGLAKFCQDIEQIDLDKLAHQLTTLENNLDLINQQLERCAEANRQSLEAQYELIFRGHLRAPIVTSPRTRRSSR